MRTFFFIISRIFPISKSAARQFYSHNLIDNKPFLKTSCGNINRNLLHPDITDRNNEDMLPTGEFLFIYIYSGPLITIIINFADTGSRIGVIFVPMKDKKDCAEMHFIVNGDDLGPQVRTFLKGYYYVRCSLFGKNIAGSRYSIQRWAASSRLHRCVWHNQTGEDHSALSNHITQESNQGSHS